MVTMKLVIDDELQALLLLSSLPDSWETYHLVILLRMVCYNLPWLKIVCLMKKLEERIWARILHMLLSQRTRGEVRVEVVEVLKGEVNLEVSRNQKENSSAFIVIKKVT